METQIFEGKYSVQQLEDSIALSETMHLLYRNDVNNNGYVGTFDQWLEERHEDNGSSSGDNGGSCTICNEIESRVQDIEAKVFPLESSYVLRNDGTYEVGTSITPSVSFNITRKGVDVSSNATINVTGGEVTIGSNKKGWTARAISSGSKTYSTSVTQGGQTINLGSLYWSFTYYRYRGTVDSIPDDYAAVIKALSIKELSTYSSLLSTPLAAGKYYLFAVKGVTSFVVRHAQTGGAISGCVSGRVMIGQENNASITNEYSYVLVPASSSSWNFTIN